MAWAKESWKGYLLSSSLLAWKRGTHLKGLNNGETKRASKSSYLPHNNTWLDTKPFAVIRNKEIGQDQVSAYFCTSSVVWAGHDVYPTTESLDDLDASRIGIHHHVMYTTPSLPTMLLHIIWFPGYRFWDFTISFYISRCIFLHTRALKYIPPTRRVSPLAHMSMALSWVNDRWCCQFFTVHISKEKKL